LASTDASATIVLLQRLSLGAGELFVRVDDGHPETQSIGEIMARSSCPVTLDERRGPKVFQTRTGTGQRLTTTFRTRGRMLHTNDNKQHYYRNRYK